MNEKPLDLEKKLNFIFHNIEDELLWRLEKKKLNKTEIRSILKGSKEYLLKEIKQQIKSAVEGLLDEIEEWKEWSIGPENEIKKISVKRLIKKWFPDVFREVNENE